MSNEHGVRLKAHTLFTGLVLCFPISHSHSHLVYLRAYLLICVSSWLTAFRVNLREVDIQ